MNSLSKLTLLAFILLLPGCSLFESEPVRGCTDGSALNYDSNAEEDDQSCRYSKVVFYSAVDAGAPVSVNLNGSPIGSITAIYPQGPGNCSAPGTISHQLRDSQVHDWDATNGVFLATGTVQANSLQECIRVRVF